MWTERNRQRWQIRFSRGTAAPPILLLPNVWDALSARLFVAAGFDARMWLLRICSISEFDPCHRSRKKPTTENLFIAIVCC